MLLALSPLQAESTSSSVSSTARPPVHTISVFRRRETSSLCLAQTGLSLEVNLKSSELIAEQPLLLFAFLELAAQDAALLPLLLPGGLVPSQDHYTYELGQLQGVSSGRLPESFFLIFRGTQACQMHLNLAKGDPADSLTYRDLTVNLPEEDWGRSTESSSTKSEQGDASLPTL